MAGEQNFRLREKQGNTYLDLFPSTLFEAIDNIPDWLDTVLVDVEIPPSQAGKQIVEIDSEGIDYMANSQFEIYLKSGNQSDYDAISQAEIVIGEGGSPTNLVLTRLFDGSIASITVTIVFFKKGV